MRRLLTSFAALILPLTIFCGGASAAGVQVQFDTAVLNTGPFPADTFTVPDTQQKTGKRVALPLPDCTAEPSTCKEYSMLNTLDGFNVNPRFKVRFSAPVNVSTLPKGIFFVALDNLTSDEISLHHTGDVSPVNQVIYDPTDNTVYGKPDQFLDQHRRYLLVVTDSVKDTAGDSVLADPRFTICMTGASPYCGDLQQQVAAQAAKFAPARVVAASIFTTQSTTAWLQLARTAIQAAPISVTRVGTPNTVDVSSVVKFTLHAQTQVTPPAYRDFNGPLRTQGGLRVAFLSMKAPNFGLADGTIPPAPTGVPLTLPARTDDIQFHVFLPTTPAPAAGYPVILVCHGFGENRFTIATSLAPAFAAAGFATISLSIPGHGFGPLSTLIMTKTDGSTVQVPAPGRSTDLNGDNVIDGFEGGLILGIPNTRDTARQAVVEYMMLVRAIRAGLDADGTGKPTLDGSRIYDVSHSFGVTYGTILNAMEPNVRAAALIAGAGSIVDAAAIALPFRGLTAIAFLSGRVPNLLNRGDYNYEQNYVYRNLPPVVNDIPGAIALQNFFERSEWYQNNGDALGYVTHLQQSPLPGNPKKPILTMWHTKDVTMPNPMTLQWLRGYGLTGLDRAFRQDLARTMVPRLPADPHRFTFLEGPFIPEMDTISAALQAEITGFFQADGVTIPDVNPLLSPSFGGTNMIQILNNPADNIYFRTRDEEGEEVQ
jgi:hypothetical protein